VHPKVAAKAASACPFPSAKAIVVPINIGETAATKVFGRIADIQTCK
jgi:hypothetical protein